MNKKIFVLGLVILLASLIGLAYVNSFYGVYSSMTISLSRQLNFMRSISVILLVLGIIISIYSLIKK